MVHKKMYYTRMTECGGKDSHGPPAASRWVPRFQAGVDER